MEDDGPVLTFVQGRFAIVLSTTFFIISLGIFQDETRKKAVSTYLVENATDLPPPRYQQDGTLSAIYQQHNNIGESEMIKIIN